MREIKFRAWDFESAEWLSNTEEHSLEWLTTSNIHLMQYTGLKDKNGKEIYEGDIVVEGKLKWVVMWDEDNAQFRNKLIEQDCQPGSAGLYHFAGEVIGNIYENPEIMGR